MSSVRRVIVGASGSHKQPPGAALRPAPGPRPRCHPGARSCLAAARWYLADRRTPCEELRRLWAQDARERLQDALSLAWGELPADLPVRPVILRGRPGPVLVNAACRPSDLLLAGPAAGAPWPGPWAAG